MKRFAFLTMLSAAVVGLACLGCGSDSKSSNEAEAPLDEANLVDDSEAKADSATTPIGTYKYDDFTDSSTRGLAKYSSIVLKTDKTFHLVRYGSSGGGEFDGTYAFQKDQQTGKKYMSLATTGPDQFRFEYKMKDSAGDVPAKILFFRDVRPGAFFIPYKRADVEWCNAVTDCGVQNYAKPECKFEWSCDKNVCAPGECQGDQCPLTGVLCTPDCNESGKTAGGAPCTKGTYNEKACACDAIGGGSGTNCPLTGVLCTPDCSDAGKTPGGAPCTEGIFNSETCACDAAVLADGTGCPLTGVLCTPDCQANGKTPGGAPCQKGTYNTQTCACDADTAAGGTGCPLTGLLCTPDCDSGKTQGGVSCTKGVFNPTTCNCDAVTNPDPDKACTDSLGTVETALCCGQTGDFPNTCMIGACGCAPAYSHEIKVCNCGPANCFDGTRCVKN